MHRSNVATLDPLDFDKKCKEVESRHAEKLAELKKQLDMRSRQIDKYEASLKGLTELKSGWKKKFAAKEGELEALKVCLRSFHSVNTFLLISLPVFKRGIASPIIVA